MRPNTYDRLGRTAHLDQGLVLLPSEHLLYTSPPRTSIAITTPDTYPGNEPFNAECRNGRVHITNQRIIYLPLRPTPEFRSFTASLRNLHDSSVTAPFFGANSWQAALQPVPDGGIPARQLAHVKIVFREGGAFDFHTTFEGIKERLRQVVRAAHESGRISDSAVLEAAHLEQLPAYSDATNSRPAPGLTGQSPQDSGRSTTTSASIDSKPPVESAPSSGCSVANPTVHVHPVPDGPPPDYEEAQLENAKPDPSGDRTNSR
ncbi:MAG: hypothetical protein M1825_005335 [Sarcosagium campestre]|nr:MAG: hypothetical protein M1825_005335 [Sarcosagium campestre]